MATLRIELLQDCEMNSGRVVNSLFSDDVFFDGFGLPFIPAWIVRNSLVKTIEDEKVQLNDEDIEALIGQHAHLVLDDALAADRESIRQAILTSPYAEMLLRNPQNVLNASGFVKVKKTSGLRGDTYVRMLAKGTILESYVELEEPYMDALRNLVAHTNALFVGYEVRARFTLDESWARPKVEAVVPETSWDGETVRLEYSLHLVSHKTTLDHISGEMKAKPYMTGAEIRDALSFRAELAGVFGQGARGVRCANAYINVCGRRGLPIPLSYSTKKQDKTDLRDRCSRGRRPNDYDQIKGVGTLFIDDPDNTEVHAMSVHKEQAIAEYYRNGSFKNHSFHAVGPFQTFEGFIEGSPEQVKRIYDSLMANGYMRIGNLANLGFGNALIEVKSVAPLQARKPVLVEEATVLLASDTRLYRDGIYEPSAQNVLEEIQSRLADDIELEIVRNSQKTCLVSTYNKVWGELDPLEYAMQAGSIYRVRAKDRRAFDVSAVMGGIFIGGHTDAGYGETWVMEAVDAYYRHISYDDQPLKDFPLVLAADPNAGRRLMRKLFQSNANALAAHMGATKAEPYVFEEFIPGALSEIQNLVCDDFDLEQVFEAYVDSLKEAGLNAIRRGHRD